MIHPLHHLMSTVWTYTSRSVSRIFPNTQWRTGMLSPVRQCMPPPLTPLLWGCQSSDQTVHAPSLDTFIVRVSILRSDSACPFPWHLYCEGVNPQIRQCMPLPLTPLLWGCQSSDQTVHAPSLDTFIVRVSILRSDSHNCAPIIISISIIVITITEVWI